MMMASPETHVEVEDDPSDDLEPDVPDVDDFVDSDPPEDPPGDGGNDDDDGDASGPWVTIATFWEAPKVHLARIKLESEGIPCVIADENIIATDWLMANAVGGIKLQVPESRAADAVNMLRPAAPPVADEPIYDGQTRCPQCGSERIERPRFDRRLSLMSLLLLNFPIPIFTRKKRCEDCGHMWIAEPEPRG